MVVVDLYLTAMIVFKKIKMNDKTLKDSSSLLYVDDSICGQCKKKLVGASIMSPTRDEDKRYLCVECMKKVILEEQK